MKQKLKDNSGETLVETLFALLVVVLAMTMLAGSIVFAARVNKGAEDLNTAFCITDNVQKVNGVQIRITGKAPIDVTAYQTKDQNKYCYYITNGDAE